MGSISFLPAASNFLTTQGNLCLPILSDLAVYAVFRRARSYNVSEIAGAFAGLAVGICLSSRTSFLTNLTGAGLYAAYKVIHYIYVSLETPPPSLEEAFDSLMNKITITAENDLNAASDDFDGKFDFLAKTPDAIFQIRKKWNDPAIIQETEMVMFQAYQVICQELQDIEEATQDLASDQDKRNAEMVEYLDETFYSAVEIFYETYRHARNMCFYIKLPFLRNVDERGNSREFSLDITPDDCLPFGEGVNPKFRMKKLFNHVNELFKPLLEYLPSEIDTASWKIKENWPLESDDDKSVEKDIPPD